MAKTVITLSTAILVTLLLCFTPLERPNRSVPPTISMQEPIAVHVSRTPEKREQIIPKEEALPKIIKLSRSRVKSTKRLEIALSMSLPELDLNLSPQVAGDLTPVLSTFKGYDQVGHISENANADMVFNAGEVDIPPNIKKYFPPFYPPKARGQRIEGLVVVRALVLPNGLPQKVTVVSANPEGYFEGAAMDAVRRWTFYPGEQDGKKVKVLVDIPIEFNLTN